MVVVLPSTRMCTRAASAACASAAARTRTNPRRASRRSTNPPSARGSVSAAGGRSSDSGLPPTPPSRPRGQWLSAWKRLPLQRRDRPGLAPGSLSARRYRARAYHRPVRAAAGDPARGLGALECGAGALERLLARLGADAVVVRSREELAQLAG